MGELSHRGSSDCFPESWSSAGLQSCSKGVCKAAVLQEHDKCSQKCAGSWDLHGEESVGKAKEKKLGELQMKKVPGLAAPLMLSMEGAQGGDPTPRKGVSQLLGLLGWLRQGWIPVGGKEGAGQMSWWIWAAVPRSLWKRRCTEMPAAQPAPADRREEESPTLTHHIRCLSLSSWCEHNVANVFRADCQHCGLG